MQWAIAPSIATTGVTTSRGRLDNLTGLRAFAAAWVMLGHFCQNSGVGEFIQFPRFIFRGGFGVDLFFVLSGVVITLNYLGALKAERPFGPAYRDYLAKRFARIYPLHLATFLTVIVLVWVASSQGYLFNSQTLYTPFSALLNLTLMQGWGILDRLSWNTVSWSLSAEWFAYLLVFPVCVYLLERCTWTQAVLIVAALWIGLDGNWVLEHRSVTRVSADGFLRILPEFMAGYLLCRRVLSAGSAEEGPRRGTAAALFLALIGWLAFVPITWYAGAWDLLVLPATVTTLWGLTLGQPIVDAIFGNRLAVFLGETSFALYMLHPFVKAVGDHVMRVHPAWRTQGHALPLLVIEVAAAYLIAGGVYLTFERPARRGTLGLLRRAFPTKVLSAAARRPLPSK